MYAYIVVIGHLKARTNSYINLKGKKTLHRNGECVYFTGV